MHISIAAMRGLEPDAVGNPDIRATAMRKAGYRNKKWATFFFLKNQNYSSALRVLFLYDER
jgi:hypothetical protein